MITEGLPETMARTLSDLSDKSVMRLCTVKSAMNGRMPYRSGVETEPMGVEMRSASKMVMANS